MQSTSPIPPKRQMMTHLFRCRAHCKTSHTAHTTKGIHQSRARSLNRKNRRHHGLSAACSGPGKIDVTICRKVTTAICAKARCYSARVRLLDRLLRSCSSGKTFLEAIKSFKAHILPLAKRIYAAGMTRAINRLTRVRMANDIVSWFQWLTHQHPP